MSRARPSPEWLPLHWRVSPPSNCRDDFGSPLGAGDPPDYSMFAGKSPLGTCHRGGTLYVLRLPQQSAVSSPYENFVCRDPRGLAGLVPHGHCLTVSLSANYPAKNRGAPRVPPHGYSEDTTSMRLPVASGIPQVAHPESSIPKPGRDLPLAGLSAVSYAFVRSSTRTAMSRATERLLLVGKDSPPSNGPHL